ncbi:histidine phosphatase family protein [Thalassoroseus pseudoceratinae]|uniref:histidine phosphatase family protein n=1 Tax=Thalassoroseus pseudoceratinae TaxID=2713176 RepID=UPI0014214ACC|nr:histidine phosphatase family protein [Thalassoroseus pseudoceratinae]
MPQVVIIRPGCTDFAEQNRIQGALDIPLNPRGLQQVEEVVSQLAECPLEVLYADPSEASRRTAEAIADELGISVKLSEDLRNLDQGLWQGLQIDDVRHKYPKAYKQWQDSPETICPPEGETVPEALERVRRVLRKPLKKRKVMGIVVAEPLATIIASIVRKERLEMPEPNCQCHAAPRLEFVESSGTIAESLPEYLTPVGVSGDSAPVTEEARPHGKDSP